MNMKKLKTILTITIMVTMALGFAAFMNHSAYAATDTYTNLVPTWDDNASTVESKKVYFNGKPWHIIEDNSTGANAGTLTLLVADTSFGVDRFHPHPDMLVTGTPYEESQIKSKLQGYTNSGSFKSVSNAIVNTSIGKLYLLSNSEVSAVPTLVRMMPFTGGDASNYSYWWLRDCPGAWSDPYFVRGSDGALGGYFDQHYKLGIRPALKLDLSKVAFDTTSKTFSLAYSVKLGGGANADVSGGATTQESISGAMTTVTYTAKDGYHFDKFNDITSNGITAKRTSDKVITVSGTPTNDATITIPDAHAYGDWRRATDPTCAAKGQDQRVCANDSTIKETRDVAIDPDAHSYKFKDFTWTGSEKDGYTAAVANYECEHNSEHTTTVPATIGEPVVTDPTCTKPGKTTYTATVEAADSLDGTEHTESKDAKATDPTDHKWKFEGFTWTGSEADGYTAAVANYVCEHNSEHTTTVNATLNDETIAPTCTEPGKTIQTATIAKADSLDGKEHTDSKDAKPTDPIKHSWGEPTYTWSDDNSSVTAKRVCAKDTTHVETETVDATSEVTRKATCTEKGEMTYTSASFDNKAFTVQTKKEDIAIDPDAHKYGDWTKVDDKQHQRVCELDETHIEKKSHSWDAGKVTKKATKTSTGEKTYTCTLCEATKTETIPKLKPESTAKPVLVAKAIAKGSKAGKISWNKVKGADRYVIYLSNCNGKGKIYKAKKVKTVSGNTYKWTRKKLKENRSYKFYVVAQKKSGGSYKTIAKSKISHFYTGNERGRYTNPKSLKLKKSTFTLKKGKTATIKASVTKVRKNKKLSKNHTAMYRYISNDPSVAAVSSKGKITAKKTGSAVIYVQTINGIWKTCKVTVR